MNTWQETTLGIACEIYQPKTISAADLVDDGEYPVYGANGVIGRYDKFNHAEPQLLITCRGATCGSVNVSLPNSWINGNAMVIRPRDNSIELKYLEHLFRGGLDLTSVITGAAQPQITRQSLAPLKFRFPPLPEQRRIAAILDQADALRAKRREALAQLDSLTQSIFVEMFGDPLSNSKNLTLSKLIEVSSFENGDRSSNYPSGDDIKDYGVLFLSTKNISNGRLDLTSCSYITREKFDSLTRGKARKNDILITLRGTLGSCCIFDCTHDTAFINAQMMIVRPYSHINPLYLHALLTSPQFRTLFARVGQGAAVPQLTAAQMSQLQIPVPSEMDQFIFESRIQALSAIKRYQEHSLVELDALFASLQHRAFRGEL